MLRPATPLTILLFAAFVLLLISVISTPVVKTIPLATFGGVDFGVFGYCQGSKCSAFEIGYDTSSLFTSSQDASFDLPAATRTTLSAILIVHPIAAFFTLIMLALAFSAHFHSPSHSPRYLLGMFILSILTLLVALLAFLIDVLLFVPHMAWGSYIVLAATILIAASGIVSCAMRRTLVSRKARKRRIAENAEMNGENFYNRQNNGTAVPPTTEPTAPMVTGANGENKLPSFATFDINKQNEERTSDERQPLTARPSSERSPEAIPGDQMGGINMVERYGGPPQMGQGPQRGGMQNGYGNPRDQYGNPVSVPGPGFGPNRSRDPSQDPSLRNKYSNGSLNQRGRGGYEPPPRGGFAPRGRGGYGPPVNGRGGYGPSRGGYGPQGPYRGGMGEPMAAGAAGAMMGRGARGQPPGYLNGYGAPQGGRGYNRDPSSQDSYNQLGRQISGGQSQDAYAPGPGGFDRRPSAGSASARSYNRRPSNPNQPMPSGNFAAYPGGSGNSEAASSLPRAESPPPIPGLDDVPVGQAVEMDANTGSPQYAPNGFGSYPHDEVRESNSDIAGMVGLQQGLPPVSRPEALARHATVMSDTSRYSSDEPYVPPRAAWGDNGPPAGNVGRSSPLNPSTKSPPLAGLSHKRTNSSDMYYEDVDPRFAEPTSPLNGVPSSSVLPAALTPGGPSNRHLNYPPQNPRLNNAPPNLGEINTSLPGTNSYEDLHAGSRSPAESDRSNFTSVSQRGINPRWNPALGPAGYPAQNQNNANFSGGGPQQMMRRPVPPPQRENLLLQSNPDFELPGGRGGRGGRGGPVRGRGAGPYPGGL